MKFEEMQFRAVAFVPAKAILWKSRAKVTHHGVARYLRDHARRRDTQANAIPINNRRLRPGKRRYRKTIDENMIG